MGFDINKRFTTLPEFESENFKATQEVLNYIVQHPYRASFNSIAPRILHRAFYGKYKANVFALMVHLTLMGLDNQVLKIKDILDDSTKNPEERLNAVVTYLYEFFEVLTSELTSEQELAEYEDSFKKLKKLIHKLARENDIDRRLFNVEKITRKLEDQLHHAEGQKNSWTRWLSVFFSETFKLKRLQEELIVEELSAKERKKIEWQLAHLSHYYSNRKYAFIDDRQFDPVSSDEERRSRRVAKRFLRLGSTAISVIVGISEGIVAAVFAAVAWPFVIAMIFVGVPGFISNFYLFNHDSYEIFKDIYSGRIFKKANGKPLSTLEKGFLGVTFFFCLAAAVLFGLLSFGSGIAGYTALLALVGLSANPIGIMVVAGIVAVVMTIALFTVFSYLTVNWIRKDGPKKLWHSITNLKSNFINFWKHENWSGLTLGEKVKHVVTQAIFAVFKVGFFNLAVAVVIVVNVATLGQLKHHSLTVFNAVFGLSKPVANLAAFIVVGLGSILTSVFYGNGTMKVFGVLKDVGLAIVHPIQTYKNLKNSWESIKSNPTRLVSSIANKIGLGFLFSCVGMNGLGQADGLQKSRTANQWVHGISQLPQRITSKLNFGGGLVSSGGVNLIGAANAAKMPVTVSDPSRERVDRTVRERKKQAEAHQPHWRRAPSNPCGIARNHTSLFADLPASQPAQAPTPDQHDSLDDESLVSCEV